MMKMPSKLELGVAAVVLVLVAGCQSSVEEAPEPERTPTPSANEATPSDELPELPEVAKKKTRRGAAAFAEYYYDLVNYGRATGDWDPLKDLTLPGCERCADFWADEPSRMDDDRRIAHLRKPAVGRFDDPQTAVALRVTSDVDLEDIPVEPGHEWADLVWLDYRDGRWVVKNLDFRDLWPESSE